MSRAAESTFLGGSPILGAGVNAPLRHCLACGCCVTAPCLLGGCLFADDATPRVTASRASGAEDQLFHGKRL
jgi:hypothetical protein